MGDIGDLSRKSIGGGDTGIGSHADTYRPYHVGFDRNLFSVMRSLRGALFDDALDPAPSSEPPLRDRETGVDEQDFPGVLFWPGCTLSAYAPELTSVAYKALADANRVSAMTVRCCGNILRNIGEASVFEDYRRQLLEVLVAARVEKIIVACPGCYHNLRLLCEWEALKDVEIQALPVALCDMELPMVACDPGASVCVHDSCPDRSHGVFADGIRALLAGLDIREVQHNRRRSQCCGMGKLRALTHPELSAKLTDDRLFELKASGADTVVAGCLTCVGALQPVARHYLELAFRTRVDWNGVHATMEEALKSFDAGPVAYTGLEERSSLG